MTDFNVLYQIFTDSIRNELKAKLADLFYVQVKEFGYRQFLSNGTTIGFCTRNLGNSNSKIKDSCSKALSYESLKRFYNQETCNSFIIYRRTADKIEGFYFLSSSKDSEIISYYLKYPEVFEHFINQVSLYANLALGSIKCNYSHCKDLGENSYHENLYVKVLSQNSIDALFQKGSLINKETIQNTESKK